MQFGGLFVLSALTAFALASRYYLKSGTSYERSYLLQSIQKKKFDQIVIDLIYTNYLNEVFLRYSGDFKFIYLFILQHFISSVVCWYLPIFCAGLPLDVQPKMELWIRFYAGLKMKNKFYICNCNETSKICICNIGNYVRLITIKAKFAIENMTLKGYGRSAVQYVLHGLYRYRLYNYKLWI